MAQLGVMFKRQYGQLGTSPETAVSDGRYAGWNAKKLQGRAISKSTLEEDLLTKVVVNVYGK
jgi:hypothetical protein